MNKQLSFTDIFTNTFEDDLQDLLNEIIVSKELPQKSLHIFSNKSSTGANAGNETSKSICIYEPDYPSTKADIDNPGKNSVVLNIQIDQSIELLIRKHQFDSLEMPATATLKSVPSDTTFKHVLFEIDDTNLILYIKKNILYCLEHYNSKAKTFGCCSKFTECSDAGRCVHENKLYATACSYKRNLDSGKIFYGKNKNI